MIYRNWIKRPLEATIALVALVTLSPVLFVLGILIFLSDFKTVLYKGSRVGLNGKDFEMLKFRTMRIGSDKIGPSSTSLDDPRITKIGAFLRRTKLDELPQLWNVLKGEMSIVGPRPQVRWAVELYTSDEQDLLSVRPGITDFASLAFRNEGEILRGSSDPDGDYLKLIAPTKIQLGLQYARGVTAKTDLKIVLGTILALFGRDPHWVLPPVDTQTS